MLQNVARFWPAAIRSITGGESHSRLSESKMVETSNSSGTLGEYTYDGDGRRVKKYVPSTGEVTVFVYDAAGKQIAEYSTIVEPASAAKVNYLTTDHLGSPHINTDANGCVNGQKPCSEGSFLGASRRGRWYTLQDSNLRPSDPKSDALFN